MRIMVAVAAKKKIIITGGSGFLGSRISELLINRGYEVVSLDLRPSKVSGVRFVKANLLEKLPKDENLKSPHAVINLAGKLIFGRWNENFKDLVRSTRVTGTQNLVQLFSEKGFTPKVLIGASAVGYYGDAGAAPLDEDSAQGQTFLSQVAADWEAANMSAVDLGVRVAVVRNGHILGRKGGMIKKLLPFYKKGLGGPLGDGKQFFPWVHIDDVANIYIQAMETPGIKGTINAVAPEVITNKEFSLYFANTLKKAHWVRIPAWSLRVVYGEFADEMLVSQKVYPRRLQSLGYEFTHPKIGEALGDILE